MIVLIAIQCFVAGAVIGIALWEEFRDWQDRHQDADA